MEGVEMEGVGETASGSEAGVEKPGENLKMQGLARNVEMQGVEP